MKNRILPLFMSLVMALNLVLSLNISVEAASATRSYKAKGYTVTYTVQNKKATVTLTNTGSSAIKNWALQFDGIDGAANAQNAVIYSTEKDRTVVRFSAKSDIAPGAKTTFSFEVNSAGAYPKSVRMLPVSDLARGSYNIKLADIKADGGELSGDIVISGKNMSIIASWELSFDSNFRITKVTGAKTVSARNMKYTFVNKGTPALGSSQSVKIHFRGKGDVAKPQIKNAVFKAFGKNGKVQGNVKVSVSDTADSTEPEFIPDKEPVSTSHEDETEPDYTTDTDGDGIPDYYEDVLGTDKNRVDTDNDGLTDGQELTFTNTDPTKRDTDNNGISDGDEDPDKDGLSNKDELARKTDPFNADCDEDGLNDGDEVKCGSDPFKADTDGDGISDADEISLNLDPTKKMSDGKTPDNERTFEKQVKIDSERFSRGDEKIPYDFSVDISSAGYAPSCLGSDISGYSATVDNPSIVGALIELSYPEDLKFDNMTMNFKLDNSIVNNTVGTYAAAEPELKGIKRLQVFRYFDEVNMLLPIKTEYNTSNNTISAHTDLMGTYCLVDKEIYLQQLGVKVGTPLNTDIQSFNSSFDSLSSINKGSDLSSLAKIKAEASYKDGFNVVFIIDTRVSDEAFAAQKENILSVSRTVLKYSPDARIYIFLQNTDIMSSCKVLNTDGRLYFTDYKALKAELEKVTNGTEGYAILSDGLKAVNNICENDRDTYAFSIFDEKDVMYRSNSGRAELDKRARNLKMSIISETEKEYGYAHDMYSDSGKWFKDMAFAQDVADYIYGRHVELVGEEEEIENIVKSNDLEPLPEDFGEISADSKQDYDRDGLTDAQEIDFALMEQIASGRTSNGIAMPGITNILSFMAKLYDHLIDVDALKSFDADACGILLLKTDVTDDDTDRDGFDDGYEVKNSDDADSLSGLSKINKRNKKIVLPYEDADHDGFVNGYEEEMFWFNPNHANSTFVNDESLDDSKVFQNNEGVPCSTGIENHDFNDSIRCVSDGHLPTANGLSSEYTRNRLIYSRSTDAFNASYTIIPKKNSDYKVSLFTDYSVDLKPKVEVYDNGKYTEKMLDEEEFVNHKGYNNTLESHFILEKGKKYRITLDPNNIIVDGHGLNYILSIEQDNWVYAPYGAYCKALHYGESWFLPQEGIYEIIKYYNNKALIDNSTLKYPDNYEDYLKQWKNNDEAFKILCQKAAADLFYLYDLDVDQVGKNVSSIGNTVSIIGLCFVFGPETFGIICTVSGAFCALYGMAHCQISQDILYELLYQGRMNLRFNKVNGVNPYIIESWNNTKYINKYAVYNPDGILPVRECRFDKINVFVGLYVSEVTNDCFKEIKTK